MAMEIINFVIKIGEWLWVPVGRQIGYLVHYKSNMESLNAPLEKLEAIRQDNQVKIEAAKLNAEEIKAEVQTWLKGVDAVITESESLKNEANANKKCFGGGCPDLRSRRKVSKKALKNRETIHELQVEGSRFDKVSIQVRRPIEIESTMSSSTEEFEAFESTKKGMDEVMGALKDDKVKIVGVFGMGGVGKTTMVKRAGVEARKAKLFDYVIIAVVSQNPNLRKIQGQLADMLALKLEEEEEPGRAARLKERIMRTKRILIILDDLWKWMELSEIGIPSGSDLEACKSKIILTTRIENVCFAMGSQAKIHLNVLSEQDSWTLFRSKAGEVVDDPDFNLVARKVAEECGGLPIALVVVARALGDKDLEEWKEAARKLEMSKFPNLDDDQSVFKCIKLSYDYLRDDDHRLCFVICCLFPEDSDITMEDLVKYGMGQGLFQDANTVERARAQARTVAKRLKSSSLLLESEQEGCVKMHDVVRDMGVLIASAGGEHAVMVQAGIGLKDWPRRDDYGSYMAISLMSNEIAEVPDGLVCPKLKILLLQNNNDIQEIPEAFFQEFKSLRVFDMSNVNISLLPSSVGLLADLRTLYLDRCQLVSDISILAELRKLEILSLRESYIEELPQEIGQLVKLRMLDITMSNNIKRIPPKVISSLSHLEELYMQGSFSEWGQEVEGTINAGLDELTCLPRLNILKVDIWDPEYMPKYLVLDPKWVKFDICVSRNMFNRFLNVHLSKAAAARSTALVLDTTINTLPNWFNKVATEKAERLFYVECRGLDNILTEYAQRRLNGLKSLLIQQCYGIVDLMNSTNCGASSQALFQSLEELRISNMDNLKQICVGQLPKGSLGRLKFLEVQQCNDLVDVLLQPNLLQRLQNLEVLNVSANSLQEVFRTEQLEEGPIVLWKLREMKLDNLPELTRIWNGPSPLAAIFHNLKVLTVTKCKKLGSLFTKSVSRCLLQLEDLWIDDCGALEGIIGRDEDEATIKSLPSQSKNKEIIEKHEEEAMEKIVFPKLKNLLLQNLPHLRNIYSGDATVECPSLEELHVQECPYFRTSVSDFHSNEAIQVNNEQHFLLLQKRLWELRQIS